jgi:hypothetical protein
LYHLASETYDPSMVYITHSLALARDHAAGYSNWLYITTGVREPGKVYSVIPMDLVIPDFVPPCCCCLTHSIETECCAKTKSAMVDTVYDEDVMPVMSAGWVSTIGVLAKVYNHAWKGKREDDYLQRSSRRSGNCLTSACLCMLQVSYKLGMSF